MKSKLLIYLLFFSTALYLYSCVKENTIATSIDVEEVSKIKFDISEAKLFFETNATYQNASQNPDFYSPYVALKPDPVWEKSIMYEENGYSFIFVPLKYKAGRIGTSYRGQSDASNLSKAGMFTYNLEGLIIQKNSDGSILSKLVNIIPSTKYVGKTKQPLTLSNGTLPIDFSGIATIYDLNGKFTNGFSFKEGLVVGTVIQEKQSRNSLPVRTWCWFLCIEHWVNDKMEYEDCNLLSCENAPPTSGGGGSLGTSAGSGPGPGVQCKSFNFGAFTINNVDVKLAATTGLKMVFATNRSFGTSRINFGTIYTKLPSNIADGNAKAISATAMSMALRATSLEFQNSYMFTTEQDIIDFFESTYNALITTAGGCAVVGNSLNRGCLANVFGTMIPSTPVEQYPFWDPRWARDDCK